MTPSVRVVPAKVTGLASGKRWWGSEFGAAVMALGALWISLVHRLSYHWAANPQYAYGWSVPLLALLLLWQGWHLRPVRRPEWSRWSLVLVLGLVAALLPVELLLEVTPDWRFAQWSLAVIVVGLTLAFLFWAGGSGWLQYFAFAPAFIFLAVPWPVRVEQTVIRGLTEFVTGATLVGLDLAQIPVARHGYVLELGGGFLGIESACSGVRSFQGMLMVALFLGQLRGLAWPRRLLLVGLGVAVSLLGNVARTLLLAVLAERRGVAALEEWHDPAGFGILLLCTVVLALAAYASPVPAPSPASPGAVAPPRPVPRWIPLFLAAAIGAVLLLVEVWYRSASSTPAAWWTVAWPVTRRDYLELPLLEEKRGMQCDEGRGARWREASGTEWTVFFFRWLPGCVTSRILARFHQPTICLPAVGLRLVGETGVETVAVGRTQLLFRTYLFAAGHVSVHVFFCVWEDRQPLAGRGVPEPWTPRGRWQAVLRRDRQLGQQVLEVALIGAADAPAARAEFLRGVAGLLRPDDELSSATAPRLGR